MSENTSTLSLKKEVIIIALPAMFETLFTTLTGIINSKMVSVLGTVAISAIAVTNQPRLFIFSVFFAINTVISAMVATNLGKNDKDGANRIFISALSLVLFASIVLGILSVICAKPILEICSGQADTMEMSVSYFRIIMGGMVFNQLFTAINAGLRGCGNTSVTFLSSVVSCVTNIVLNYCLISGRFGFPALGINGAAISTIIGTVAATIFSFVYLYRAKAFISFKYCIEKSIVPSKEALYEFFLMWKHVLGENLLTRIGFLITSTITARAGSFAMAVYAVGMHLMDVNYAIASGFQASAVALIGRSNGEGKKDKINKYADIILRLGLIFAIALSAVIVVFAKPYYALFNKEAEFIQMGIYVCYIIAIISPIQIVKIIHTGFLQGLGQMKKTKEAAMIAVTIVQPICCFIFIYLLSLGIWGIWISTFVSQVTWLILSRSAYLKTKEQTEVVV